MSLPLQGRTERRLALLIFLTSVVPLVTALFLARSLFHQASSIWFDPEVGRQLDRGVDLYKDYVRATKDNMRHQSEAMASDERLHRAMALPGRDPLVRVLRSFLTRYPELLSVVVEDVGGAERARVQRERPFDGTLERSLEVRRPIGEGGTPHVLVATFAFERKRLDELENAGNIVARYHALESSRGELYQAYLSAHAVLLALTMAITVVLGIVLARGVTRRLARLANAFNRVAAGDLSVRVPVTGSDELTELAAIFNRMLGEVEQSRTRIEYLQRIGAWQEMAQRLAHEIKNPLTPIQLAVQECHRKYGGGDPNFRMLLDTTLEIVEEEVGTLRRLVGTFSDFARMPHAELKSGTLREFLRECSETIVCVDEEERTRDVPLDASDSGAISIAWNIPDEELPAAFDRQMLRRVLVNLVENASQAIRGRHRGESPGPKTRGGHISIGAKAAGEGVAITVEDDGPGVPESLRARVFDPYVTTRADGTGLGLAIVKKIVVEHGGRIEVGTSRALGGACFTVCLPSRPAPTI